jgi:hypothetical protein
VLLLAEMMMKCPDTTPNTSQMVVLGYGVEAQGITTVAQWENVEEDLEKKRFGITGGQHHHVAILEAAKVSMKVKECEHWEMVSAEVYALGALQKIEALKREREESQGKMTLGELEKNLDRGVLGYKLLTGTEKAVLQTITSEDACLVLINEHNDVPGLHQDSNLKQKMIWIRGYVAAQGYTVFEELTLKDRKKMFSVTKWPVREQALKVRLMPAFVADEIWVLFVQVVSLFYSLLMCFLDLLLLTAVFTADDGECEVGTAGPTEAAESHQAGTSGGEKKWEEKEKVKQKRCALVG